MPILLIKNVEGQWKTQQKPRITFILRLLTYDLSNYLAG